jgi:hypothetical protein
MVMLLMESINWNVHAFVHSQNMNVDAFVHS